MIVGQKIEIFKIVLRAFDFENFDFLAENYF